MAMNVLEINLLWGATVFTYRLSFVNRQAATVARDKILDHKKDDPAGVIEIVDDFSQAAKFHPGDVKACFVIDKERESELLIQFKLQEMRTNIELANRVQGDAALLASATRNAKVAAAAGSPPIGRT